MESLSLGRFTIAAPVWPLETNLSQVLHKMSSSNCDRGVVVDRQRRPLGLLTRSRMLAHWPLPPGSIADLSALLPDLPPASMGDAVQSPPGRRLLEPLWLIPSETTLAMAWSELQAADHHRQVIALVDRLGQFAGLLDSCKLLQILQRQLDDPTFQTLPTLEDDLEPGNPAGPICTIDPRWFDHGSDHKTQKSDRPSQVGSSPHGISIALVSLLQQLPLPLMLQTETGTVLMHNQAWQSQVGLLQDPDRMHQAATPLLKFPKDSNSRQSRVAPSASGSEPASNLIASDEIVLPGHLPECEAMQPGSCLCRGTTQDGRERTWHLTRISLACLATEHRPSRMPNDQEPNDQEPNDQELNDQGSNDQSKSRRSAPQPVNKTSFQLGRLQTEGPLGLAPLAENKPQGSPSSDRAKPAKPKTSKQGNFRQEATSHPIALAIPDSMEPVAWLASSSLEQVAWAVAQAWSHGESLWLVLAEDRTEQHQVTRELAAKNADLTQLNRLKDEFLACISHELKTPLTAILGLSSLLQETALGALNDRQTHYVQLIHQSGRHLSTIVNNILDLTRIETGQFELSPSPVNLAEACIRACLQFSNPDLYPHLSADELPQPTKGIQDELAAIAHFYQDLQQQGQLTLPITAQKQLQLEIDPGLETLTADDLRLRQMLIHLIANAVKFTENDDQIGLQVSRWQGWIAFTVWDTGIGIPEDKQHLIFQKFQQLENPLSRRFEGAGLGLVLTQRLARLHGGDVTFISTAGQGSRFTLLLPPVPPMSSAPSPGHPSWPDHKTSRSASHDARSPDNRLVLVVESAVGTIDRLSSQLKGMGYWVAIARSGTEAMEKVRKLQPCVVFLNPILPMLSGWDVVTLLKANPETQNIPVVIMATSAERHQALHHQVDRFLRLPIQPELLWQTLADLVPALPIGTPQANPSQLTILLLALESDAENTLATPAKTPDGTSHSLGLMPLLQAYGYRILEVDDLDHANLLSRFWKPDVVLLHRVAAPVQQNLQQLADQPYLATLPLVTLTEETTSAAHAVGLSAFPCLAFLSTTPAPGEAAPTLPPDSALIQALQVAAGLKTEPYILAVDLVNVPDRPIANSTLDSPKVSETSLEIWNQSMLNRSNGLQALVQYLQVAGLHSVLGQTWQEVVRQLEHERITTLLICLRSPAGSQTETAETIALLHQRLAVLEQLPHRPQILVLDHHQPDHGAEDENLQPEKISLNWRAIIKQLQALAREIIPPTLPMNDLLKKIQTTLAP